MEERFLHSTPLFSIPIFSHREGKSRKVAKLTFLTLQKNRTDESKKEFPDDRASGWRLLKARSFRNEVHAAGVPSWTGTGASCGRDRYQIRSSFLIVN